MEHITIATPDGVLALPRTRKITVIPSDVGKSTQMASGRIVKDVIGHRLTVVAKYDYVPNDLVVALNAALRKTPFLMVEYPAPGGTESGVYEIEPLSLTLFKFDRDSGLSVWHEVTLTMVSQEVYR